MPRARPDSAAVRAALAALDRREAEIRSLRAELLALSGDLVPMKAARTRMRLEEDAALKRARRGAGLKIKGRWYFERAYVEANTP